MSAVVNVVDFARARLPELEALEASLADAPPEARHLRRKNRSHVKQFVPAANPAKPPSRRQRRKAALMLASRDAHADEDGDKNRLLETHLYHAKRFAMVDSCGWRVPQRRNDRGLKAARTSLATAALVFDVTYDRPLEVTGDAAARWAAVAAAAGPEAAAAMVAGAPSAPGSGRSLVVAAGDAVWIFPRRADRPAAAAALGGRAGPAAGGLVRLLVRGAEATAVVNAALRASLTDGDAGAALRVRDPRDDRSAAAAPDPGVFDAAARAASTDAVRLVRDDVLNAERSLAERRPPLDMPVVVVRARSASPLAAGWDVVAPAGWGRAVFHALVTRGGHAGGVDERGLVDAADAGGDVAVDAAVRARPGRPKKDDRRRGARPAGGR